MLTFNQEEIRKSIQGALGLRPQIEQMVEEILKRGFDNICFLGIGGTLASAMQVTQHMKEKSHYEMMCESAASYLMTGNRRIHEGTLFVFATVTGSTPEIVQAVKKAKATIVGFIDDSTKPIVQLVDYLISYPGNEQLKMFLLADCLMKHEGVFDDYEAYYHEMDHYLADALVDVGKRAESFASDFVAKHHDDALHYFVGAGNQWGATYSYAMCYWEEMHWRRTKSIHAAEFFHGMLEVVDRDTNVTVFVGEDCERPLAMRVANFLPQICARYTIIDTKDYPLHGISEKYRGSISHLVMRQICHRIDMEMERVNCHPTEIRRYYRQLEY